MLRRIKSYLRAEGQESALPSLAIHRLEPGAGLVFSAHCPLQDLAGRKARVVNLLTYRFGNTRTVSYQLMTDTDQPRVLTVAEDADGYYLAISRPLGAEEQHRWFDRDTLGFFTEPSSAKTLKCREKEEHYPGWTAPKFIKSIDMMEGSVGTGRLLKGESARQMQPIRYSLLVSEAGDKAVEIERVLETGALRVFVTVYRPAGDVTQLLETIPHIPAPPLVKLAAEPTYSPPAATPPVTAVVPPSSPAPEVADVPVAVASPPPPVASDVAAEPATAKPAPGKPDFRRLSEVQPAIKPPKQPEYGAEAPPLPAFLVREKPPARRPNFIVLDEILPPEIERVRCDITTAKLLIDTSISRGVRVRDLLRQMTGLTTPAHDEVLFEMPLSEEDYMQLAQRYHLKPDLKSELRHRLMEEIQGKIAQMQIH
jgi:hypothetical protein